MNKVRDDKHDNKVANASQQQHRRLYEQSGATQDGQETQRDDPDDLRLHDDEEEEESKEYFDEDRVFGFDEQFESSIPIRRLHRRTRSTSDMIVQRINIPGHGSSRLAGTPVTKAHYSSLPESPAVSFLSQWAFDEDMAGRMDFGTGTIVAGYVLGDVVGRGTFSECREATKAATGEHYAIKIIQPMVSESSEVMLECGREVSVWRRLSHPNILPLVDCMFIDGSCVCVMPLCDFGNLKDYLDNNGSLDERTAKQVFKMICSAVHYLHTSAELVHRDVKLENVLLDSHMNAYLCDFGLTETLAEQEGTKLEYKGTPEYIPPEIINKNTAIDLKKADVWALGVCLYAMVCGELPFHHEFTPKLYQNIVTRQVTPLPQQFSPELHALIGELLEKDPLVRPSTESILRSRWLST